VCGSPWRSPGGGSCPPPPSPGVKHSRPPRRREFPPIKSGNPHYCGPAEFCIFRCALGANAAVSTSRGLRQSWSKTMETPVARIEEARWFAGGSCVHGAQGSSRFDGGACAPSLLGETTRMWCAAASFGADRGGRAAGSAVRNVRWMQVLPPKCEGQGRPRATWHATWRIILPNPGEYHSKDHGT
jgi:hypothetical protein